MSEAVSVASTLQSGADPTALTAGQWLKREREAAGLHIAALAVALKVPVKKLEALEADRFEALPDAVFVRALAASVCRSLRIDPAPVLERLPQHLGPKLSQKSSSINAPFRAPSDGPGPSLWAQISRPAVLGGAALLLGALVIAFLPTITSLLPSFPDSLSAPQPNGASAKPALPTGSNGPEAVAIPSGASAAAQVASEASLSVPNLPLAPTNSATLAINSVANSTPNAASPTGAAVSGLIVIRAISSSWVEVVDAKRQVVLRRTLDAGEAVAANGQLPLQATIGRADATQVEVRGQAFDLRAVSKNNVAKFEVK